ncbi:hypothetical protein I6F38_01605 [Bradyrhizobium sp. BRP56]|nr:hypothetical protein [Bradyrhizobium sp. BRP56]
MNALRSNDVKKDPTVMPNSTVSSMAGPWRHSLGAMGRPVVRGCVRSRLCGPCRQRP